MPVEEWRRKYEQGQIYVSGSFLGTLSRVRAQEQVSFGWETVLQWEILPSFLVSREKNEALNETNSAGLFRHSLVLCIGWTRWFLETLSSPWF